MYVVHTPTYVSYQESESMKHTVRVAPHSVTASHSTAHTRNNIYSKDIYTLQNTYDYLISRSIDKREGDAKIRIGRIICINVTIVDFVLITIVPQ